MQVIERLCLIRIIGVISAFLPIIISIPCYANPLPGTPIIDANAWLIVLWIGCAMFEAGIIAFVLWGRHVTCKAIVASFILLFLLNIVTILITSFLAGGFFGNEISPNYWAELFPVVIESLFVWYLFHILHRRGYMEKQMHPGSIILLVLIINLITFLVPYLIF